MLCLFRNQHPYEFFLVKINNNYVNEHYASNHLSTARWLQMSKTMLFAMVCDMRARTLRIFMTFSVRIFLVEFNNEFVHGHNPNGRCLFAARQQMSKIMFFCYSLFSRKPYVQCKPNTVRNKEIENPNKTELTHYETHSKINYHSSFFQKSNCEFEFTVKY